MAGRLELIKSIIQSMLVYSIIIYKLPRAYPLKVLSHVRKKIWCGDGQQRKLVTIAWDKLSCPLEEGGLRLRNFSSMNNATLAKLAWEVLQSKSIWSKLMRA